MPAPAGEGLVDEAFRWSFAVYLNYQTGFDDFARL
jgi:hypothetical protein